MSGFGKLHQSMWDGSLYGHLEASATLMALVTLCNAEGVIDMTPEAISGRTGWPIEFIKLGIEQLEAVDPRSRTPDHDGRRIVKLDEHRDWGWLIVNYEKYREKKDFDKAREQTRERVRKFRERNGTKREVTNGNAHVTFGNAPLRQAEAEAEADKKNSRPQKRTRREKPPEFHEQVIAAYHATLPDLPAVKVWTETRRQYLDARIREMCARGKNADEVDYWQRFFGYVAKSDWLCGRKGDFRADLEWLITASNFVKVIEGRYANGAANG